MLIISSRKWTWKCTQLAHSCPISRDFSLTHYSDPRCSSDFFLFLAHTHQWAPLCGPWFPASGTIVPYLPWGLTTPFPCLWLFQHTPRLFSWQSRSKFSIDESPFLIFKQTEHKKPQLLWFFLLVAFFHRLSIFWVARSNSSKNPVFWEGLWSQSLHFLVCQSLKKPPRLAAWQWPRFFDSWFRWAWRLGLIGIQIGPLWKQLFLVQEHVA